MIDLIQPPDISEEEERAQWQTARDLANASLAIFDADVRRRVELLIDADTLDSMQAVIFIITLLTGIMRRTSDMLAVPELVRSNPSWPKGKPVEPHHCIRLLGRLLADTLGDDEKHSAAALRMLQVGLVMAVQAAHRKEANHG